MRLPCNGEVLLTDPAELWQRSTFPAAVTDDDAITPAAFRLRSEDNGELSGTRSSIVKPKEAEDARRNRQIAAGRKPSSGGTWGVTVQQLNELKLQCFDDTADITKPKQPTGHAFVDLVGLSKAECNLKATELAQAATANGRLA